MPLYFQEPLSVEICEEDGTRQYSNNDKRDKFKLRAMSSWDADNPRRPLTLSDGTLDCQNTTDKLLSRILFTLEGFADREKDKDKEEQQRSDWMLVAVVLDRVLFFVFTIITVIVCVVLLNKHPEY